MQKGTYWFIFCNRYSTWSSDACIQKSQQNPQFPKVSNATLTTVKYCYHWNISEFVTWFQKILFLVFCQEIIKDEKSRFWQKKSHIWSKKIQFLDCILFKYSIWFSQNYSRCGCRNLWIWLHAWIVEFQDEEFLGFSVNRMHKEHKNVAMALIQIE